MCETKTLQGQAGSQRRSEGSSALQQHCLDSSRSWRAPVILPQSPSGSDLRTAHRHYLFQAHCVSALARKTSSHPEPGEHTQHAHEPGRPPSASQHQGPPGRPGMNTRSTSWGLHSRCLSIRGRTDERWEPACGAAASGSHGYWCKDAQEVRRQPWGDPRPSEQGRHSAHLLLGLMA